jgi:hypothetical protein
MRATERCSNELANIMLGWKGFARDKPSSLFNLMVSYDEKGFRTIVF